MKAREDLCSGWLWKQGEIRKSVKKRWFVCFSDRLVYAKSPESGSQQQLGELLLSGVQHVAGHKIFKKRDFCIEVVTKARTWYFWAETDDLQKTWLSTLQGVCKGGKSLPPVSVAELPENTRKLLLLGVGNVGKSTILKEMQIHYREGFVPEKRMLYRDAVFENVFVGAKSLVSAVTELGLELLPENECFVRESLLQNNPKGSLVPSFQRLWRDPAVVQVLSRRRECRFPDSMEYFMANLDRLGERGYCPSVEDVLRVREVTRGMQNVEFRQGKNHFTVIDVGGQVKERDKTWLPLILTHRDAFAVIYVISMSSFDEIADGEKGRRNAFDESLEVWQDLLCVPALKEKPVLVIFNKMDVLRSKLASGANFQNCLKLRSFNGKQTGKEFVRFVMSLFERDAQGRDITFLEAEAVNVQLMKVVLEKLLAVLFLAHASESIF
jgi:GTPase SAR1 family protein